MAFDLTPSAQFKTGITYFITNESVYKRQQDEYRYHVMGARRFPAHYLNIGFPEFEPGFPEFEPRFPDSAQYRSDSGLTTTVKALCWRTTLSLRSSFDSRNLYTSREPWICKSHDVLQGGASG